MLPRTSVKQQHLTEIDPAFHIKVQKFAGMSGKKEMFAIPNHLA